MQPALLTGTQGERGNAEHEIKVRPPLVGLLGDGRDSGQPHEMDKPQSNTKVRVPVDFGGSGIHRESRDELVKIKAEPYLDAASADESSPQVCEHEGSTDHQGFRGSFKENKIERQTG